MSSTDYSVKLEFLKNSILSYPGAKSAKTDTQINVEVAEERDELVISGLDPNGKHSVT